MSINFFSNMNGYDALKRMCEGHTSDEIALHLIAENGIWCNKKLETASARLRACLSPNKSQYLSMSELVAVMQYTKRYEPLFYMCEQLGLSQPVILDSGELLLGIENKLQKLTNEMGGLFKQVEQIKNDAGNNNVHSLKRSGIRFSREPGVGGGNVVVCFKGR